MKLGLTMNTTMENTLQTDEPLTTLENTLAEAERSRESELSSLKSQLEQSADQYSSRTKALLHAAQSVLVPPSHHTIEELESLTTSLQELHQDYLGAQTASTDLAHDVEEAYQANVDAAFTSCFLDVHRTLQSNLSAASPMEDKRELYNSSVNKQQAGTADAIDLAIIKEFEQAQLQATASLEEIMIPIRVHDAQDGQLHIDIPITSGDNVRTKNLYQVLENALGSVTAPIDIGTRFLSNASLKTIVSALSAVNVSGDFKSSNICGKVYTTEGVRVTSPESEEKEYSILDLTEHFGVTQTKMNGILYRKIGRNDLDHHSEFRKSRGPKKRRMFSSAILPLIEQYITPSTSSTHEQENDEEIPPPIDVPIEEETPPTRVSLRRAANLLRYRGTSAVHNNANLTKIDDELERPMPISKRQRRILRYYDKGLSLRDIAKKIRVQASTVTRNLRASGVLTREYIESQFSDLEKIKTQVIPGVRSYPKDEIRIDMLDKALKHLRKKDPIRYLGLEGPHFCSYIEVARTAASRLRPSESLIAEKDELSYRIMQSFAKHSDAIEGGEIFSDLNVNYGELHKVVSDAPREMNLNFVNLDYEGHVSSKKIETLNMIFEKDMLADQALLFVTLNDSPRIRARVNGGNHALGEEYRDGFGTSNQEEIIERELGTICQNHEYGLKQLSVIRYESRKSPMLIAAYKVWR
jgi:predicted DNA-binding protein YlxM (UPF0122 family)